MKLFLPITTVLLVSLSGILPASRCRAQSQAEMTQEAAKDFSRADAQLNTVYKKVLADQDEKGKEKLIKAQRAWLAYRDAQAAFEADASRGGSMEPMLYSGTQARLTRERITLLRESLSSDAPGKQ